MGDPSASSAVTTPGPVPLPPAPSRWPWPPLTKASAGVHVAAAGAVLAVPASWPWALGGVALNHLVLTALGLWPRSQGLGPNITRLSAAAAQQGHVALTIDDGPDLEVTPAVLDILAAHGAKASFFCIADPVVKNPALAVLLRRIVAQGHSVQNHSAAHQHHFSFLGPRGLAREIQRAQTILSDTTGTLPHCFRAPAGLRNPLLDPVLHQLGLHLVSWTRRGFDTREQQPQKVLNRLTKGEKGGLAGGDILLLHDGHAARTAQHQPVVLQVLPALLAQLKTAGLHTVTLAQAVAPRHARELPP